MGFIKFALIFVISLALVFGYSAFRDWKVENLQNAYNYNLKDVGFWTGYFMSDHSAGYVYMWKYYNGIVLFFNFVFIFLFIYFIIWKLKEC